MLHLDKIIQSKIFRNKLSVFDDRNLTMSVMPYYLLPAITLLAYILLWNNAWLLMLIIYALLPLIDQVFTLDQQNPDETQRRRLQRNDIYYKICLYVTVALDWGLFFKVLRHFSTFEFTFWNIYNLGGLFFMFSNLNAVQFAVAHQIFHKNGPLDRLIGTIHMSKNLYMHFTYEHLYGHHRRVATPQDPASAEKGISLYSFFPRTFFGSYKSVYQMQKQLKKPFILNYCVLSVIAAIAFSLGVYYFYNFQTLIFFMTEAFLSIFYLQAINYIQHYGLRRAKLSNGQYEKVDIRHSWNAPHRFSNYILFKLQRHSDHHENSLKPYQTLLSLRESPHLPHGYSLIIFLSFFPSRWFSIMDKLVDEYEKNKKGCVKNEVTQLAYKQTKKFAIELGLVVFLIFSISFLR